MYRNIRARPNQRVVAHNVQEGTCIKMQIRCPCSQTIFFDRPVFISSNFTAVSLRAEMNIIRLIKFSEAKG